MREKESESTFGFQSEKNERVIQGTSNVEPARQLAVMALNLLDRPTTCNYGVKHVGHAPDVTPEEKCWPPRPRDPCDVTRPFNMGANSTPVTCVEHATSLLKESQAVRRLQHVY